MKEGLPLPHILAENPDGKRVIGNGGTVAKCTPASRSEFANQMLLVYAEMLEFGILHLALVAPDASEGDDGIRSANNNDRY